MGLLMPPRAAPVRDKGVTTDAGTELSRRADPHSFIMGAMAIYFTSTLRFQRA
jgi:hypothetical protein